MILYKKLTLAKLEQLKLRFLLNGCLLLFTIFCVYIEARMSVIQFILCEVDWHIIGHNNDTREICGDGEINIIVIFT